MAANSVQHKLLLIFLILGFSYQSSAIYTPVALTGFNADVVADIPGNASGSTTADYDNVNYVFMSASYNPSGTSAMPAGGLISSVVASTPGLTYQLQPYTANNSLRMSGTASGVLNFVSPTSAQTLYVLGSTGSGVGTATITVTFTDLTTQVFTGIVFPDWYNGANFAIQGMGRTNRVTNVISNDAINPRLYQAPLALLPSNYAKLIQSVSFSNTGGVLNIMAISIDTPPIPCTGTPIGGSAIATSNNPCPGTSICVSLSGASVTSGLAYQWQQSSNCAGPWVNISSITVPSAITSLLCITPPSGATLAYRCIITCTNTGLTAASSSTCVVVQPWSCTSPCYPASSATSGADQDILNVTLSTLNNTTNCTNPLIGSQGTGTGTGNMYSDFTSIPSPSLPMAVSIPFSLTIGTCAGNIASSVSMFIDYNHNAVFDLPGEEVYTNTSIASVSPSAIVTGNLVIPPTAFPGCTRIRVVMMSSWIGTVQPTGTYGFGETEDYLINILPASSYDPSISAITVPTGTCFTNNETVTATLTNYGSNAINLLANPVAVTLQVNGPSGLQTYNTVMNTGILNPYGANSVNVVFPGVNLYAGGNYSINTSISISGLTNGNLQDDSLSTPVTRSNYRPVGGPDYPLCAGSIIPFGQGLSVSGCATPIHDSIDIQFILSPGQPPICTSSIANPTGACEFATAILPALPAGSTINSPATLTVTQLASASLGCITCTWPNEKRFSLFQGMAPPSAAGSTFYPGAIGNTATTGANAQGYTYTNQIDSTVMGTIYSTLGIGGTLKMGSWNTYNTTANNHVINYNGNPTVATIRIRYTYVPASFEWYKDSVGGPILYTYSPFNPIGVTGSGISNSNTPGVYPFYASCAGSSGCRVPVNLVIHPTPPVVQDTLTTCEFAVGSNNAVFDLTSISNTVSAFTPGTSVSYFGDQALFLPIANPTNDTSSTNFIYSKVMYTTTGCYSSDSLLLSVSPVPQFTSSPLLGNACAPSAIDVASLINPFTTTAGADTLYYNDNTFTTLHPNPHAIYTPDTVYMVLATNTIPVCSDTAVAYINIIPSSNYIANQDIIANYSICGSVGCGNITLNDGATETLFTTTDCRKIATVTDAVDGVNLGSVSICEEIDCSVPVYNGQPYLNRKYKITPTNNDSAIVCLYYLDQDIADYNAVALTSIPAWPIMTPGSNLCITKVDNGDITDPGHVATAIPQSVITTSFDASSLVWTVCFPVSGFSYFYCHTCNPLNIALPVTLLQFQAQRNNQQTDLHWITSHEENNSHFIVERSQDAKTFSAISNPIPTQSNLGNSNIELQYTYRDTKPQAGHNYYRLQQVDIDGNTSYSQQVDVYFGDDSNVTIFPNPVESELNIDIQSPQSAMGNIQIIDATGRIIKRIRCTLEKGTNHLKTDLQDLSVGMYRVEVRDENNLHFTGTLQKK